jgi:hypothetical protein
MVTRKRIRRPPLPRAAYSVREFCEAYAISKAMYYKLRREGFGPVEMRIGTSIRISLEAAQAWNRAREAVGRSR